MTMYVFQRFCRIYRNGIVNLTILILTFFTLSLNAQDPMYQAKSKREKVKPTSESIPKGANSITVFNDLDKETNFNQVAEILLKNGFEIEESDRSFHTIRSGTRSVGHPNAFYYLYFVCMDGQIMISGKFNDNTDITIFNVTARSTFLPITNRGMQGSVMHDAFDKMDDFAHKVFGDKMEYQVME